MDVTSGQIEVMGEVVGTTVVMGDNVGEGGFGGAVGQFSTKVC